MHDIYNPPPAPVPMAPPEPLPLPWRRGDVFLLLGLCTTLAIAAVLAWGSEPVLGLGVIVAGVFVIIESWFSALTYLHRHPANTPGKRALIFLAALAPWALGLGVMVLLMMGLFRLSDWLG